MSCKIEVLIKTFNLDTKTWLYLAVELNDPLRGGVRTLNRHVQYIFFFRSVNKFHQFIQTCR